MVYQSKQYGNGRALPSGLVRLITTCARMLDFIDVTIPYYLSSVHLVMNWMGAGLRTTTEADVRSHSLLTNNNFFVF